MLTVADILEALCGIRPSRGNQVITDAVIDSREVSQGSMFIALPGDNHDGHDFVGEAFQSGASIALIHRASHQEFKAMDLRSALPSLDIVIPEFPFCILVEDSLQALQSIARYWRQKLSPRVIGITGSVGKSTTKELVAEVIDQRFSTLKNPGNLNNEIGLPLTLLRLDRGHQVAVLEMGFYVPGEIALLCDIAQPQIGVVTNIGTVHAERAGSQEAIARGKAELVESLPAAPDGIAILNHDDPLVRPMAEKTRAQVFFYGLTAEADLWADEVEGLGLDGIRFRLHYKNEIIHLQVPLIGRHSVHTVLRASAVGLSLGLTWQDIVNGLRSGKAQLRLVAVRANNDAVLLDDTYNASPTSTLAALNLLDEIDGNKIAVLGDMLELGQYEWRGHEMVGVRAAEVADELITVGERAKLIASAALRAGLREDKVTQLADSQQAIDYLLPRLKSDDVVLVKGSRGMRMDYIVAALEQHK